MEISQRKSFINIILWKIQMLNTSFKVGENERICHQFDLLVNISHKNHETIVKQLWKSPNKIQILNT